MNLLRIQLKPWPQRGDGTAPTHSWPSLLSGIKKACHGVPVLWRASVLTGRGIFTCFDPWHEEALFDVSKVTRLETSVEDTRHAAKIYRCLERAAIHTHPCVANVSLYTPPPDKDVTP